MGLALVLNCYVGVQQSPFLMTADYMDVKQLYKFCVYLITAIFSIIAYEDGVFVTYF